VADINLTQEDAEALLAMEKHKAEDESDIWVVDVKNGRE
jgi:hypothetical protein